MTNETEGSTMRRFVTFVDGSNLDGVLKHLNLRVDDYGAFYRHVFEQSVQYWGRTFADGRGGRPHSIQEYIGMLLARWTNGT